MTQRYSNRGVRVPHTAEMQQLHCQRRIAIATLSLFAGTSSLKDDINATFRTYDGVVADGNGIRYRLPNIDGIFPDDAAIKQLCSHVFRPQHAFTKSNNLELIEQLKVLAIFFSIRHSQIARHFK